MLKIANGSRVEDLYVEDCLYNFFSSGARKISKILRILSDNFDISISDISVSDEYL